MAYNWMDNLDNHYYSPGGNLSPSAGPSTPQVPTRGRHDGPAYVSPTVGGSHGGTKLNWSGTGVTGGALIMTNNCYTDLYMGCYSNRKTDKPWYEKLHEILQSCGMQF